MAKAVAASVATGLAKCSRGMVTGAKAGLGLASTEVGILTEEVTTTLTGGPPPCCCGRGCVGGGCVGAGVLVGQLLTEATGATTGFGGS